MQRLTLAIYQDGKILYLKEASENPKFIDTHNPKTFKTIAELQEYIDMLSCFFSLEGWLIIDTNNTIDRKDWRIIQSLY